MALMVAAQRLYGTLAFALAFEKQRAEYESGLPCAPRYLHPGLPSQNFLKVGFP